ncbi:MAG: hypothetical protein BJ554DRAFT_7378 [Olpidium bornovanus]|uniref:Uncharacterized protein n=1 Tax=Olpidium bornovanus TaxID=278681 RepID=A0A8H7ZW99_9FUNG|nr:MAG: hypothetical protein BJ554DRAFT_7378 [Olpidium bornovanus]
MEEPQCNGCRAIIHEGNVVAFGEGIWHLDWWVMNSPLTNFFFEFPMPEMQRYGEVRFKLGLAVERHPCLRELQLPMRVLRKRYSGRGFHDRYWLVAPATNRLSS